MIDVSLRALRYFAAAAERGNVTLAARELNVSQPSISLAIAQLERSLGVQLFVRQHARGVALTPAGTEVLREVRKLLSQANDFSANLAGVGEALRGTLSIGCLTYLLPRYLGGIISGFTARHPEIELAFREGDQAALQNGMLDGEIEVALTYDLMLPRRFTVEPLLTLPPYVLLPAGHRLARRTAISLRDIHAEPCVLLDLPISRDYFAAIFGALRLMPNMRYRTTSVEAVRSFVGNGLGYSVLNHPSRTSTTYDGKRTKAVALSDSLQPARVAGVHLADHRLRPAALAFLAFAREFFSEEGRTPAD
ncbi:MAG: LysR family transcriptional regulator [Rhodospirillaceae bacterium]|nr:LysR family transcriptional regulator [Rhodospirillaceae bacterium]